MAAGRSFVSGFMGCLGVLAAIIALIFVLMVVSNLSQDRAADRRSSGTASAHEYLSMCATAFVRAKHLAPKALTGGEPSIADPTIVAAGPPVRIHCGYTDRRGRISGFTADIICQRELETDCVRIVSVLNGAGDIAYLNKDAR